MKKKILSLLIIVIIGTMNLIGCSTQKITEVKAEESKTELKVEESIKVKNG